MLIAVCQEIFCVSLKMCISIAIVSSVLTGLVCYIHGHMEGRKEMREKLSILDGK